MPPTGGLGTGLNGRAGIALLPAVVGDICARAGVAVDAAELDGVVSGYRFDGPLSARMALEPLATAYGVDAIEQLGEVVFRMSGSERLAIDAGRLAEIDGQVMEIKRSGLEGEAVRVRLRFVDAETDHEPGVVVSAGSGQCTSDRGRGRSRDGSSASANLRRYVRGATGAGARASAVRDGGRRGGD